MLFLDSSRGGRRRWCSDKCGRIVESGASRRSKSWIGLRAVNDIDYAVTFSNLPAEVRERLINFELHQSGACGRRAEHAAPAIDANDPRDPERRAPRPALRR
ncbi:CGNR zinc finger domain-containing protein [Arvimicrobium flavum]|uniref:CGNR zinc finger domain-containing protein n=1 Tax=Arvimicrobium flavum TaxID=3393320 RepID=UPI00237B0E14|nr:CGNR zinc finger domain-containing protein [Mesorhizobium shangrilense]